MEKYSYNDSFTIYFIISCQDDTDLKKYMINLSPSNDIYKEKDDLIIIKNRNGYFIDIVNKDFLNGKNIYLYVATINSKNIK